MEKEHWDGYLDRLEDLGEQILDLVAELRADPPRGWPRPGLGAIPIIADVVDVPTKCGLSRREGGHKNG